VSSLLRLSSAPFRRRIGTQLTPAEPLAKRTVNLVYNTKKPSIKKELPWQAKLNPRHSFEVRFDLDLFFYS
jgi:hypothetical protein